MYEAGTLERLVLSDRILVTYVPLPATSSESVRRNPYERSSYLHGFDGMPPSVCEGATQLCDTCARMTINDSLIEFRKRLIIEEKRKKIWHSYGVEDSPKKQTN